MSAKIDQRLQSETIPFQEIPIVDISTVVDGSDLHSVARQIGRSCEKVGFVYLKNHGVSKKLIGEMYDMSRQFFALPQHAKDAIHIARSGPTLRGYIPEYGENVDPDNTRDYKEVFDYGKHETEVSPFRGPNPMPECLPQAKVVFEQYHSEMVRLARKLISVIALGLKLPADYFDHKLNNPISIQRVLHYPPQYGEITQEEIGAGAHTDYGFLTILAQDDIGGLQVQNSAGDWVSVPPIEDTFVFNIGDFLETFTNGRYRSTLHRVVNTAGRDRYSIAFFMDLDFDAVVEPVPTVRHSDGVDDYPAYVCGEHKYKRFLDSYEHLKELV
ncbi:MAG: 2OG-Fe(II) oxygenase family protein [Pseudomonadota bacterium]